MEEIHLLEEVVLVEWVAWEVWKKFFPRCLVKVQVPLLLEALLVQLLLLSELDVEVFVGDAREMGLMEREERFFVPARGPVEADPLEVGVEIHVPLLVSASGARAVEMPRKRTGSAISGLANS